MPNFFLTHGKNESVFDFYKPERERNVMISFSDLFLGSKKSKKPVILQVQGGSLKEKWKVITLV